MRSDEPLAGRRLLVTAGPTREAIDPVRYLSNRSSGKMGFAVAKAAQEAGAIVTLVTGPVSLATPTGVQRIDVESARDMLAAVHSRIGDIDIFIGAAAVADYRPSLAQEAKIKKDDATMGLELVRNPDVLASVAALPEAPFTVGFAAETHDLLAHARDKLQRKNVDMIAANQVGQELAFEKDENALFVIWRGGELSLPMQDKLVLARALLACVAKRYLDKQTSEAVK